jgi:hypothetical protein
LHSDATDMFLSALLCISMFQNIGTQVYALEQVRMYSLRGINLDMVRTQCIEQFARFCKYLQGLHPTLPSFIVGQKNTEATAAVVKLKPHVIREPPDMSIRKKLVGFVFFVFFLFVFFVFFLNFSLSLSLSFTLPSSHLSPASMFISKIGTTGWRSCMRRSYGRTRRLPCSTSTKDMFTNLPRSKRISNGPPWC